MEHFSGMHNWYACSHARPTFCNVCREALPGVTSHGLSCEGQCWGPAGRWAGVGIRAGQPLKAGPEQVCCEVMPTAQMWRGLGPGMCVLWGPSLLLTAPPHAVCKFKAHKRCAVRATNNCKWTTLASIGVEIIEDEDGVSRGIPGRAGSWQDRSSSRPGLTVPRSGSRKKV